MAQNYCQIFDLSSIRTVEELRKFVIENNPSRELMSSMLTDLLNTENKNNLVDNDGKHVLTDKKSVSTLVNLLFSESNIIISDLERNLFNIENTTNEDENEDFISSELQTIRDSIFGKNNVLVIYNKNLFKLNFIPKIFVFYKQNVKGSKEHFIVTSNKDLNDSITNYKSELFDTIVNYLVSINVLKKEEIKPLYKSNVTKKFVYRSANNLFYDKVMNLMRLASEQNPLGLQELLKNQWLNWVSDESSTDYKTLSAFNAFVTLSGFDEMLKEECEGLIQIDPNYDGILENPDTTNGKPILKYSLGSNISNTVKDWNTNEYRDALKDSSKLCKLILSSVLVKFDGRRSNVQLLLKDVINAFSNALMSLEATTAKSGVILEAKEILKDLYGKPIENIPKLIHKILNNIEIKQALYRHFFTPYDNNILLSFYDGLLNPSEKNKTLYYIEQLWLRGNKGSITQTILNEVVIGLLNRTNGVNYNQTTYSSENGYETKTLNKATNINKRVLDYKESRNNFVKLISDQEYKRLTEGKIDFKIDNNTVKSISLTLGEESYSFDFVKVDKKGKTSYINFLADITGINVRQIYLNNNELNILNIIKEQVDDKLRTTATTTKHSEIKKLFKQILSYQNEKNSEIDDHIKILSDVFKFIDNMLALGLDSDLGYETLHNYLAKGYTIEELFRSALRVAYGMHLQYKYNEYVSNVKNNETIESLPTWLRTKLNISKELLERRSSLIKNSNGDETIVAVGPSQRWLDAWFLAEADITGANSKATTTNVEGNKMANFRQGSLATRLKHLIQTIISEPNSAAANLLFCRGSNVNMIKETAYDLDLLSNQGIKKSVKNANLAETIYNSITHHFLNSLLKDHILIQPTVYADKTSFVIYKLSAKSTIKVNGKLYAIKVPKDSNVLSLNKENCIDIYKLTVGKYFKDIIKDVKKRWVALLNLEENKKLLGLTENLTEDISLIELNKILNKISKNQLTDLIRNYQYSSDDTLPIKSKDIKIIKNTDYCVINGHLALNLELCYYDSILFEDDVLNEIYKIEEHLFVLLLLDQNINFYTYELHDSKMSKSNSVLGKILREPNEDFEQLFEITKDTFKRDWIRSGKLLIGKYNLVGENGEITTVELKSGDKIPSDVELEINPILLKYFYIDNLFGNNLKYSLTGAELIHDDKSKISISKELSAFEDRIRIATGNFEFNISSISDMTQLFELINDIKSKDNELYNELKKLYIDITRRRIASCELAQDKRNSMIPATLDHLTQGSISGMSGLANVSVIGDPLGTVFNVNGELTEIDAQDGSGVVDPFTVNLENGSLADKAVSYSTRKFITHYYDPNTGLVYFAKYALFNNSNSNIRLSHKSDLSGYNLKKKMTNLRWNGKYDLLNSRYINGSLKINFTRDVLNIIKGRELYYLDLDSSYEITNLVNKNGIYYTVEYEYNMFLKPDKSLYVALLFTQNSDIYRIRQQEDESDDAFFERVQRIKSEKNLHTIDSLFELWESMGGAYSLLLDDSGFLEFSENSNMVVTAFMNNVFSEPKGFDEYVQKYLEENNKENISVEERRKLLSKYINEETKKFPTTQEYFPQPLKSELISYCLNPTALKSYLANVNPSSEWTSKPTFDEKGMQGLLYFTIRTDTHGPQLDPYHEADEADMAEPTQVIASLDAGGATHWMAREAFKDLAKISADKLQKEAKILEDFILKYSNIEDRELIKSELYDIFARSFINYYSPKKNYDLCAVIVDSVKERFNLSSNDHIDDLKLPISDPNIFSQIMATFITKVNTAIKRRSSGLGTIMVPGYNKGLLWHIVNSEGESMPMLADDIYEEALMEGDLYEIDGLFDGLDIQYSEENGIVKFNISKTNLTDILYKIFELSLIKYFTDGKQWKFADDEEIHTVEYINDNSRRSLIIDAYLKTKLYSVTDNNLYVYRRTIGQISPTDIIDVHVENVNDENKLTFDLSDLDSYYMFKKGHWAYFYDLENGNVIRDKYYDKVKEEAELLGRTLVSRKEFFKNKANLMKAYESYESNKEVYSSVITQSSKYLDLYDKALIYLNNVIKPRNLAPLKVYWKYDKIKECNLYDIDVVYNEYLNSHIKRDSERQRKIDDAFRDISEKGEFLLNEQTYYIEEGSLTNEAAELLMSNIYASKFGLGNRSLYQVLKNFESEEITDIDGNFGQFSLVTSKNTHIFIDVNATQELLDILSKDLKLLPWSVNQLKYTKSDDDKYQFIDYTLEDGNSLEIGRRIDVSDKYSLDGNKIYISKNNVKEFIDNNTKKQLNLFIVNGKVWQNVYFVRKFELNNEDVFEGTHTKSIGYAFDYNTIKDIYTRFNKNEKSDNEKEQIENGISKYIGQTIYKIYDLNDCTRFLLLDTQEVSNLKHVLRVITNVGIKEDNYNKFEAANDLDLFLKQKIITRNTLLLLINNSKVKSKEIILLSETPIKYSKNKKEKTYVDALNDLQEEIKHLKRSSFELSRYFTAARIPAQTLQSYMLMKLVGYIPGDGNECMVSHWLTWLQGSDYDIDKAYIMGYQFSSSGKFIHWSSLFDFSSKETLRSSTLLPTPSKVAISTDSSKEFKWAEKVLVVDEKNKEYDFSELVNRINNILKSIDVETNLKLINRLKALKLILLSKLISEIDNVQGTTIYLGKNSKDYENVVELINTHEQHVIPRNIREQATLNSVSSRIQHIVGDIANISLASSPILMEGVRKPANNSPKQGTISKYTGMNPVTKYIIQELNMVGKKVIGIAAVGEKVFMGLTYYFNEGVRSKNKEWIERLKFYLEYKRIQGRSKNHIVFLPKSTIADTNLWGLDIDDIREKIYQVSLIHDKVYQYYYELYVNSGEDEIPLKLEDWKQKIKTSSDSTSKYKEIKDVIEDVIKNSGSQRVQADLMISQLLSAATDNAKELILDRINSGTSMAKMYIHLIILGFSIDDIAEFMISGAVSVIDKFTKVNMFDEYINEFSVDKAVRKAKGYVQASKYLQGSIYNVDELRTQYVYTIVQSVLRSNLKILSENKSNLYSDFINFADKYFDKTTKEYKKAVENDNLISLIKVQYFVDYAVDSAIKGDDRALNLFKSFFGNSDSKCGRCVTALIDEMYYVSKVIKDTVQDRYNGDINEYMADIEEFSKIYDLSSETSLLGTAFFGLNKGISTKIEDILSLINKYEKIVFDHEIKFNITSDLDNIDTIVAAIIKAKPYLNEESVKQTLLKAQSAGIINNFNGTDYILNSNIDVLINGEIITVKYRDLAAEYYDLIKDQYNVFDIMQRSPLYLEALNAFKVAVGYLERQSVKFTILNTMRKELFSTGTYIDESVIKKLTRYSEKLVLLNWIDLASSRFNLEFPINEGDVIYNLQMDKQVSTETKMLTLDTFLGRANFKNFIENVLITSIKRGEYEHNGIKYRFTNNKFINSLIDGIENNQPLKKLNMLMNEVESSVYNMKKFLEIMDDLIKLNSEEYRIGDLTIADYFILYGLMTSLNRYGNDRLTAIFQPLITLSESKIYKDYLRFIGELDQDLLYVNYKEKLLKLFQLGFDRYDALEEIAPMYSENTERNAKEEIIKVRNRSGEIVWKRRIGGSYSPYKYMPEILDTPVESLRKKRYNNITKDGLLILVHRDSHNIIKENLLSDNIEAIKIALSGLISKSKISLDYKCE